MNYIYGFLMAWGMFSIIPCPYRGWKEEARGNMLVMFPLIGAVIGALWYVVFHYSACIPFYIRTILIAIIPWALAGFIHIDGFMDVCDAVMSRRDLETRQKILKDSRCGAFAVIGIVIFVLFQVGVIASIIDLQESFIWEWILIPVASRVSAALAVLNLKPMHTSQYSDLKRKWEYNVVLIVMIILLLCTWIFSAGFGLVVALTMIAYWLCVGYGTKMLGGMNGDVSGYALSIAELVGLCGMLLQ